MKSTAKPTYRAKRNRRRPSRRIPKSFILAGLIVLAVALIGAGGATAYSINLENHDSFCASCHTQPETSYYQASLSSTPETMAVFHSGKAVRCIDCHSGGGPLGRLSGISRGAHDLIAYMSGHYNSPAVTTQPLGDGSCLKCHENVVNNQTFNNHFHVFLSRWQAQDPQAAHCVDCHTAHSGAPSSQAFMQDATVEPVCQACHSAIRE